LNNESNFFAEFFGENIFKIGPRIACTLVAATDFFEIVVLLFWREACFLASRARKKLGVDPLQFYLDFWSQTNVPMAGKSLFFLVRGSMLRSLLSAFFLPIFVEKVGFSLQTNARIHLCHKI
jgi:hypothetical protein